MKRRRPSRPKGGWTPKDIAVLLLGAGAVACLVYLFWLPDVRPLKTRNPTTTAYIELRKARAAEQKKKFTPRMVWTGFDHISEHLKRAVITAEDGAFYRHKGVDWANLRVALQKDIKLRRFAYGGSTITQQVARNLYLSPSKNPLRKLKEFLIARRLEKTLGKRRILELYLNIAEWGNGIYGAEAASQAYFGKRAADLTLDEAVALSVVLPSPRRRSPVARGKYVERNMARIYRRMKASGLMPVEEEPVEPEDEEGEEGQDEAGKDYDLETSSGAAGPAPSAESPAAGAPSQDPAGPAKDAAPDGSKWPRM